MLLNEDPDTLATAAADAADRWNKFQALDRLQLRAAFKGNAAEYGRLETLKGAL